MSNPSYRKLLGLIALLLCVLIFISLCMLITLEEIEDNQRAWDNRLRVFEQVEPRPSDRD